VPSRTPPSVRQSSPRQVSETVEYITSRAALRPKIGLILGSGLATLAEQVAEPTVLPYDTLPHFVPCSVEGHPGRLVIGRLEGVPVMLLQGRVHYYEGYSMQQLTFPVRLMWGMGIGSLIVTNAAGGLNPNWSAGDLMLITDHIGLLNMVGSSPLRGRNEETIGPRFPGMSQAYDPQLRAIAVESAAHLGIQLRHGVYVMLGGPSFETPAELRFLRAVGADAVGMSTVPEVTIARHAGMRVLGVSGISNIAQLEPTGVEETHEKVLEAGRVLVSRLVPLIKEILRRLPADQSPAPPLAAPS
jgi:purine-nucleoside phosphorylase